MGKRRYTVGYLFGTNNVDTPAIKITGKWLNEKGFKIGTKLEIIESKNMIILIKVSSSIIAEENAKYQIAKLNKQIENLKRN